MNQKSMNMDPKSGFNSLTKTFHSLRPPVRLPPEDTPLSATEYAFSLRANSPWPDSVAVINSLTGQRIFYSDFIRKTNSLSAYLQKVIKLSQNDVAFVLSPNSVQVPILYLSLLSLGVVVSPVNPVSTESEISSLIQLSKPVIAFATSSTVHKLPRLKYQTVLIDSPEFNSVMTSSKHQLDPVRVSQSDLAAIMYSSGTTGKVKGVMLTHRNLIAQVAIACGSRPQRESPAVMLFTMPYFHMYGFYYCLRSVALSEVAVVMERSELKKMLRAVEEFRVTQAALTPPLVVAAISKDGLTEGYDLSSLEGVVCGAAPLGKDSIVAFMAMFPKVVFAQAYGLTESTAGLSRMEGQEESKHWGSSGRLSWGLEAKIVDPETGDALPPRKHGELWIRGPIVMKGYIGDVKATGETLLKDGWMRTGDLCYIDEDGFVFVVDRLKELIKFKGFQVAPAELEQLLLSHPEIADAAVVPYPDEEAGEVPMAFVVRQLQSKSKSKSRLIKEAEIMDFVAKRVSPYKKIRRVEFVNSIPKSPAGKILRKDLIKIALPSRL
ncbi:hypothetical protein Dsin_031045 [Dipteronia sinensis]|uniref:4-coumarate--CoA ligase n=1 Tax=Dipteronia sinensis TaxID=43782 RepID=A0AAD9ZM31_9ROSI|nr:hypothetical protein Dsin_031045 [Dipteronia sinensis]